MIFATMLLYLKAFERKPVSVPDSFQRAAGWCEAVTGRAVNSFRELWAEDLGCVGFTGSDRYIAGCDLHLERLFL